MCVKPVGGVCVWEGCTTRACGSRPVQLLLEASAQLRVIAQEISMKISRWVPAEMNEVSGCT